ncbi:hypothetical protein D3C72_2467410 [compost metagenome]
MLSTMPKGMSSFGNRASIACLFAMPKVSLACRNTAVFGVTPLTANRSFISASPLVTSMVEVGKLRKTVL